MSGGPGEGFCMGQSSAAGAWPQDRARLINRVQRLKTIEEQKKGAGDDDAEDGEEAIWANSQAAISSTPTKPVAEVEFLRYGVRYRSTLPRLHQEHGESSSGHENVPGGFSL